MAESQVHMELVRKIVSYSENHFPECHRPVICADLPEYGRTPQVYGGHYPDVYAKTTHIMVLGEAKTDNDIDNTHTAKQIDCYIQELRAASCERHLVVSTSMYAFAMMKNMLARKKIREDINDVTFHVLDNISRVEVL